MTIDQQILYGVLSVALAVGVFFATRQIIKIKFPDLKGTEKLLGLATAGIVLAEIVYLGINFRLFSFALELITSIGVGMVVFGIALQHQLKNIVSGIGLFFNKEINVGDIIRIEEEKGTIIELHLTHTIALTEKGERINIPNQKFAEDVVVITHKRKGNYEDF